MRLVHKLGSKTEKEQLEVWEGGLCLSTIYQHKNSVRIVSSFSRKERIESVSFRHVHDMLKAILAV